MMDLFETIETLPLDVQNLLAQFEREGYDYETCTKYLQILESKGYSFEYGLDGIPFNLTTTKQVEKKYYFSVWRRDTKIWEGLASTKFEAVEKACGDYNRQELTAKLKK